MSVQQKSAQNTPFYRALVIDLDGTLIAQDAISSPVSAAIIGLSGSMRISIATGREASQVLAFARQLGLTDPQICDGGAMALDPADGSTLWITPLSEHQAREILGWFAELHVPFMATHPTGTITGFSEVQSWDLTRISALDVEEAVADEVVNRFAADSDLNVVKVFLPYNDLWAVDFTRSGVDKGSAVCRLAEIFGVEPGQIVGVGDSYNDIPMLRACGLRIAMGDAPDELKAMADFVVPSAAEDGLAVAIKDLIQPALRGTVLGQSKGDSGSRGETG